MKESRKIMLKKKKIQTMTKTLDKSLCSGDDPKKDNEKDKYMPQR